MDFGLGLVLSFTDNATTGINSAVSSMGELVDKAEKTSSALSNLNSTASLSAFSVMSSQLGDSVSGAGSKILGTFTNLVKGISDTGSEFQNLRITLNAIMKDSDKAEEALSNLMNFASTTPFDISDLTGMFTTITANGLDAFKTLKGATTGYEENLMSAIGDLMAFRPDVPAQQWSTAIRNAFSGEVKSLKNALDVDITGMLGRKWGKSGDIAQDFMDLADAIGVAGMMNSSMDTLNQTLSNVSDQFVRIKLAIADTGVFNMLQEAVVNLVSSLGDIQGEKLEALAQSIGGGLKAVLSPLASVTKKLSKLVTSVSDFIATHPKLTKMVTVLTVLSGGLLVLAGVGLKLASSLAGVCIVLKTFNFSFSAFAKTFKSGIASILTSVLPFALVLGGLFLAWQTDFAGIRTMTTSFIDDIMNSFTLARNSVNGDVNGLIQALQLLRTEDDVFSNMTIGIMRVMTLFRALTEAWSDYTLSEDTFQKARVLGILPLIEAILDLKYRFGFFKEGFIAGWNEIGNKIKSAFDGIKDSVKGTVFDTLLQKVTNFFQYLSSGDTDAWFKFGESLGKFTANLLLVWGAFKLVGGAIALLSSPLSILAGILLPLIPGFSSVGKLMSTMFSGVNVGAKGLLSILPDIFSFLGKITGGVFKFLPVLGTFFGDIVGIFTHFGSIAGGFSYIFKDLIFGGLVETIGAIPGLRNLLLSAVTSLLLTVPKLFTVIPNMMHTVGGLILEGIETFIPAIIPVFTKFLPMVFGHIGGLVSRFFGSTLVTGLGSVMGKAFSIFGKMAPLVASAVSKIGGVIMTVLSTTIGGVPIALILAVVAGIAGIVALLSNNSGTIKEAFMKLWDKLPNGVQDSLLKIGGIIKDFFVGITDRLGITNDIKKFADLFMTVILPKIVSFGNSVISVLKTSFGIVKQIMTGYVIPVFKASVDFIKSVWEGGLKELVGNVMMFVGGIMVAIGGIIQWLVTNVLPIVTTIVTGIISALKPLVIGILRIINGIIDVAVGCIKFFKGIFTGDLKGAWEGIKQIFSGAWKFITGVFSGIGGFFTGVVKTIVNAFKGIGKIVGDAITTVVKTAINAVLGTAVSIINGFIKAINLAIGVINALPGVKIGKLDELSVPAFAKGGVVENPTLSLIGEAGKEAVVPLENNTQWVGQVAGLLNNAMSSNNQGGNDNSVLASIMSSCVMALNQVTRLVTALPTNNQPQETSMSPVNNSNSSNTNSKVFTTNNTTTNNTNNSSTGGTEVNNTFEFKEGSIVIKAEGTEDKDLKALAKKLMEYIKRETELADMLNYN